MQHSKNRAEKEVYMPVTRMAEPEEENLPVTIMTAVSVPAWKTPSVMQDANNSRKNPVPESLSGVSPSPFAASSAADADLLDLDSNPGDNNAETTDAVILAEKNVKPSLWARLVSIVSQYSPLSITDSDLSRINLYLCVGGLLIAALIFVFIVLT